MSKTQKILIAVIIFGLCAGIAISIYTNRTPPIEKKYISLPITPPIEVDTSSWKEFKDDKYGVTVKYPEGWTVKTKTIQSNFKPGVTYDISYLILNKAFHTITVTIVNNKFDLHGGRVISNISDYISFPAINTVITRSIIPEQTEIGLQTYLYVCRVQTDVNGRAPEQRALCDDPMLIKNIYIGFGYSLDKGDKFDPNILKEMDEILQHISVK